jgi:hypothetical protein
MTRNWINEYCKPFERVVVVQPLRIMLVVDGINSGVEIEEATYVAPSLRTAIHLQISRPLMRRKQLLFWAQSSPQGACASSVLDLDRIWRMTWSPFL